MRGSATRNKEHEMAEIRQGNLRWVIEEEDLNVEHFRNLAEALVKEFGKEYIDYGYVSEKLKSLGWVHELVVKAEKRDWKTFEEYNKDEV
jgi:hypothetical protein